MKKLQLKNIIKEIINEIKESDASDKAHKMGLKSAGWGKWKDPKSNKVVAQTKDGKLVKTKDSDKRKIK